MKARLSTQVATPHRIRASISACIAALISVALPPSTALAQSGDMNGDNAKDGLDVQKLVACLTASGGCTCADVDAISGVTIADVTVFVDDLLTGGVCP